MSRGRKAVVHNNSDWESVFYNSVGTYVQYINLRLSEHIKAEPLSNHIKIVGGYAFKSSQYKKQGVPVIRISDFSNEKIVLDDVVYYDESKDLERYELNEGDIVIALTGGTIAKLGIVQKGIGKLYLNQRVGKFEVLHPEEFENEYVYWIARSVQNIIKNMAWGAAIPNVSPKQIEELQFPIPDKETQNGIIDFLNDLRANKIEDGREYFNSEVEDFLFSLQVNQISGYELQSELSNQQNLLKQLRQAFLNEAMEGKLVLRNPKDGNGTELLTEIKKRKTKLLKSKKLKEGKSSSQSISFIDEYKIPDNWSWCKSDDILFITKLAGFEYTEYIKLKPSGEIPVVRAQNVRPLEIEKTNLVYIDRETSLLLDRCSLTKKCLLITFIGAGIGDVATFHENERWHLAPNVAKAEPFIGCEGLLNVKYLNYFLLSGIGQREIFKHVKATAQPSLSMGTIRDIDIPLPPLAEQNTIVYKLDMLLKFCDEMTDSLTQSKAENEKLIKTLLNEALGIASTYNVAKDKTLKQEIRKFQTTQHSFERIKMKILEILQASQEPISATVVWNSSEYSKDIEAFYAELKRLIDIEKLVVEEKRGKESFLKLATNEN